MVQGCSRSYSCREASIQHRPGTRAGRGAVAVAGLAGQERDVNREKWEPVGKLLAALALEPGQRIADVGAGDGFYTERIARMIAPTGRVTAVDISQKALARLKQRVAAAGPANVDVMLGQPANPRLEPDTYDAVFIDNSYHEMPEYRSVLQRIHDALKPGGRLVMVEPLHDKSRGLTREAQVAAHEIAPGLAEAELVAARVEVREKDESLTNG